MPIPTFYLTTFFSKQPLNQTVKLINTTSDIEITMKSSLDVGKSYSVSTKIKCLF